MDKSDAATLGQFRSELLAEGFSEDQAFALVADTWKIAFALNPKLTLGGQ